MNKLPLPSFFQRVYSVWYRHVLVYVKNIYSNGIPPFLEPILFLLGVGLGLGSFVGEINNIPYVNFLAAGIIAPPAMFTAAYECTFGTFIRLEFDKVYDGMIAVLSLLVTSFVNNINHFNFYFTGFITPACFLSGIVFPLNTLPKYIELFAPIFPLIHSVNLMRAFCFSSFQLSLLGDLIYIILFISIVGYLAIRRLKKKIIT